MSGTTPNQRRIYGIPMALTEAWYESIVKKLKPRLQSHGLAWQNVLADTAYSSGENYAFLERENINSYIPPHGTYKGGP